MKRFVFGLRLFALALTLGRDHRVFGAGLVAGAVLFVVGLAGCWVLGALRERRVRELGLTFPARGPDDNDGRRRREPLHIRHRV